MVRNVIFVFRRLGLMSVVSSGITTVGPYLHSTVKTPLRSSPTYGRNSGHGVTGPCRVHRQNTNIFCNNERERARVPVHLWSAWENMGWWVHGTHPGEELSLSLNLGFCHHHHHHQLWVVIIEFEYGGVGIVIVNVIFEVVSLSLLSSE